MIINKHNDNISIISIGNEEEENGFLYGDEFLDNLVDCNSCGHHNQFSNVFQQQQNYNTVPQNYAVVPVQVLQQSQHFQPGLEFDSSKAGFSYDGSISQSVRIFILLLLTRAF